jgi:hypothetical protein
LIKSQHSLSTPLVALTALAVVLLLLAAPSLGARLQQAANNDARQNLMEGKPVTEADLIAWMKTGMKSLAWRRTGKTLDELAMVAVAHSRLSSTKGDVAKKALNQAQEWEHEALERAPANTYGWARLAYTLLQTEGYTPTAAKALTLSLETQRYEPSLMVSRLGLAIALLDKLDEDTKAGLPSMIRETWKAAPDELADMAKKNHYISIVEHALTGDAAALASFRERMKGAKGAGDEKKDKEALAPKDE